MKHIEGLEGGAKACRPRTIAWLAHQLIELKKEDDVQKEKEKHKSHQKVKEFFLEKEQQEEGVIKEEETFQEGADDNRVESEEESLPVEEKYSDEVYPSKGKFLSFVSNVFKRSKRDDETLGIP